MSKKIVFLPLLFLFISSTTVQQTKTIGFDEVFEKMITSINNIKTIKFRFEKNERYEGKMIESTQLVKQQVNPLKIYHH